MQRKRLQSNAFNIRYILPILTILIVFGTNTAWSGERNDKGNTAYFNGNEIEFGAQKVFPSEYIKVLREQKRMFLFTTLPDSIPVIERETGKTVIVAVPIDNIPVAINGKPILGNEREYNIFTNELLYTPPVLATSKEDLDQYLFSNLQENLNELEDGYYNFNINALVINDKGVISYYNNASIVANYGISENDVPVINSNVKQHIDKKLVQLLNSSVSFKPATKDGTPINVRLRVNNYIIKVENQKATLIERGC